MNSDLAYCLERFIDDQIQLIDDYLVKVKENETAEYQRIEQMKIVAMAKKKPETNKGSHDEDATIVQRFTEGLLEFAGSDETPGSKELKKYREMMCAEFSAKLDDCSNHIIRLRNSGKPRFRSEKFVRRCNETIELLQNRQTMKENYDKLYQIIYRSDQTNVADRVQHWWDEAYGSAIAEIIRLNKGFNPGIGNKQIAVLPRWSQPIDCAIKLISLREKGILDDSQKKYDIVCEFVRHIQSIDDKNRQEISEDDLINQLNSSEIDSAKKYAENWLNKRDEIRNQKEDDICEYRGR
jgi:hypothetical protein